MIPAEANYLVPNATFFVEVAVFALLFVGAIVLLVRYVSRQGRSD